MNKKKRVETMKKPDRFDCGASIINSMRPVSTGIRSFAKQKQADLKKESSTVKNEKRLAVYWWDHSMKEKNQMNELGK